ncbi:uncharacterized protein J3R85_005631 [Psidium guajava]|nr:uncharacterized protein J3R85_005631 [Psidium guajava]
MWVVGMAAWWLCRGSKLRAQRPLRLRSRGEARRGSRWSATGGEGSSRVGKLVLALAPEEIAAGNVVGVRYLLGGVKGASHAWSSSQGLGYRRHSSPKASFRRRGSGFP